MLLGCTTTTVSPCVLYIWNVTVAPGIAIARTAESCPLVASSTDPDGTLHLTYECEVCEP